MSVAGIGLVPWGAVETLLPRKRHTHRPMRRGPGRPCASSLVTATVLRTYAALYAVRETDPLGLRRPRARLRSLLGLRERQLRDHLGRLERTRLICRTGRGVRLLDDPVFTALRAVSPREILGHLGQHQRGKPAGKCPNKSAEKCTTKVPDPFHVHIGVDPAGRIPVEVQKYISEYVDNMLHRSPQAILARSCRCVLEPAEGSPHEVPQAVDVQAAGPLGSTSSRDGGTQTVSLAAAGGPALGEFSRRFHSKSTAKTTSGLDSPSFPPLQSPLSSPENENLTRTGRLQVPSLRSGTFRAREAKLASHAHNGPQIQTLKRGPGGHLTLPDRKAVTVFQLRLDTERNALTGHEQACLKFTREHAGRGMRWFDKFWEAYIDGLVVRLRTLYLIRWSQVTGRPRKSWHDAGKTKQHFREAAQLTAKAEVTVERLLECAEDVIRCVKYPAPVHLRGPMIQEIIRDWIPPKERQTRDQADLEQLLERTRELEQASGHPSPRYSQELNGHWPGLRKQRKCASEPGGRSNGGDPGVGGVEPD